MKKNGLTPEMVMEEAASLVLPFLKNSLTLTVSSGRGRPKKSAVVDDSASDTSSQAPKEKKPGRPKKVTTQEPEPEDLIAAAMNNTVHSSTATSPQSPPPQLAAARPSLTIDIHAAQNKDFTLDQRSTMTPHNPRHFNKSHSHPTQMMMIYKLYIIYPSYVYYVFFFRNSTIPTICLFFKYLL